jgi:hypothetical protein
MPGVTVRLREHRFGLRPTFSRCEHCTTPGNLAYRFIADSWEARLCNTAHGIAAENPTEAAFSAVDAARFTDLLEPRPLARHRVADPGQTRRP